MGRDQGVLTATCTRCRSSAATATEEGFENVGKAAEATCATETCSTAIFVTGSVIVPPLFTIGEHFISVGNGFELFGGFLRRVMIRVRSEEHTSELQSRFDLVCRLL